MAPWNMMKNTNATGEGSNLNAYIFSDTTPRAIDTLKYWTQVFEVLEHDIIKFLEDSGEEVDNTYEDIIRYIDQLELHKVVA
jgi:hypothetical protein